MMIISRGGSCFHFLPQFSPGLVEMLKLDTRGAGGSSDSLQICRLFATDGPRALMSFKNRRVTRPRQCFLFSRVSFNKSPLGVGGMLEKHHYLWFSLRVMVTDSCHYRNFLLAFQFVC